MVLWEVGEAVGSSPAGWELSGWGCAVLAKPREPSPQKTLTFYTPKCHFLGNLCPKCDELQCKIEQSFKELWSGFADRFSAGYSAPTVGLE